MEELITLSIHSDDYERITSWQLARWCKNHGANDFTIAGVTVKRAGRTLFERFDEMTEPFRLPNAKRRSLTARGSGSRPNAFIRSTELWRLTSASYAVLQEFLPDGLFTNKSIQDCRFEDPVFYRNGDFMLGVVSHEHEGIVRVTEAERHLLIAEGFKFRTRGSYVGY